MKVTYTTASGRLRFEMEMQNSKAVFEAVAKIQELFEESECGACKSKNIALACRTYESNKYFNLRCNDCNAQLDFGQFKDGSGLFAKRTDKDTKKPLPNRGWYHYQPGQQQRSSQPQGTGNHQETFANDDVPF